MAASSQRWRPSLRLQSCGALLLCAGSQSRLGSSASTRALAQTKSSGSQRRISRQKFLVTLWLAANWDFKATRLELNPSTRLRAASSSKTACQINLSYGSTDGRGVWRGAHGCLHLLRLQFDARRCLLLPHTHPDARSSPRSLLS